MRRPVGAAVEPRGMAAGLAMDEHAGQMVPGHEPVVDQEVRMTTGH